MRRLQPPTRCVFVALCSLLAMSGADDGTPDPGQVKPSGKERGSSFIITGLSLSEGSYASDSDGPARILELRAAVKALSEDGLRVVMDVVYNYITASGQTSTSMLDKVMPGYYYRLSEKGAVETSTCQNTATQRAMMEKLMVDSMLTGARAYKIDRFRFDLMGRHMKLNMLKVEGALFALSLKKDRVNRDSIQLYGEGWDFGEVSGSARGQNATQAAMAGTGIGTFNDRLHDAVRGGGPLTGART